MRIAKPQRIGISAVSSLLQENPWEHLARYLLQIQMDLLKRTYGFCTHRNRSPEVKHLMANVSLNNQASLHGCEYLVGILQAGFNLAGFSVIWYIKWEKTYRNPKKIKGACQG